MCIKFPIDSSMADEDLVRGMFLSELRLSIPLWIEELLPFNLGNEIAEARISVPWILSELLAVGLACRFTYIALLLGDNFIGGGGGKITHQVIRSMKL